MDMGNESFRVPPQDLEAEQAVLGAMILSKEAIKKVQTIIREDDFYREANRKVFKAIVAVNERSEPVDQITLSAELKHAKDFETVGGLSTLTKLVDRPPTAANVEFYAEIVLEKSKLRELINLCSKTQSEAYADGFYYSKLREGLIGELFKERTSKKTLDPYTFAIETYEKYNNDKKQKVDYIPTGYEHFDSIVKGIRVGALGTITGPFENGKSTFLQNVSVNLGKKKIKVLHIPLEDTAENILNRQVCLLNGWDMERLKSMDSMVLSQKAKVEGFDKWAKLGIKLGDKKSVGKSWKSLKFIITQEIVEHGVKVVFIEGGERIMINPLKDENKYDAQERMVDELDDIAQVYDVGIWVIVGQSKKSNEKYSHKDEMEGGTAAWGKIARQRLYIERHPERDKNEAYKNISVVKVTKNSDEEKGSFNFEGNKTYRWTEV